MVSVDPRRGRPKIHSDEEILEAALEVFAVHGFDGTSLRSLNADLGLSHGTINQRFGTKEQLYLDAVNQGFGRLLAEINGIVGERPLPADPFEELHVRFRAFMLASRRRPHLSRLINNVGVHPSPILTHIFKDFIEPAMRPTRALIGRLAAEGRMQSLSDRSVLMLLSGAIGAFSLRALSQKFDKIDGPIDEERYCDEMVRVIIDGMRTRP